MQYFKKISLIAIIAFCFSCETEGIYKGIEDIKDAKWFLKQTTNFTVEIKDETLPYNVFYYVRNSLSYPYYNLYLKQDLTDAAGNPLNLPKLKELILFDPKTGKPLGDGLGDIFDHKIMVLQDFKFPKKGKYTLKLTQDMRQDPLLGIMSVGMSVENVKN